MDLEKMYLALDAYAALRHDMVSNHTVQDFAMESRYNGRSASFIVLLLGLFLLTACSTATSYQQDAFEKDSLDYRAGHSGNITLLGRALSDGKVDIYDPYALAFHIPPIPVDSKGIVFAKYPLHDHLRVADGDVQVYSMELASPVLNPYGQALETPPEDSAYFN